MYNIVVSVKLSRDILNKVDIYADRIGVSRSELIRRAIKYILDNDNILDLYGIGLRNDLNTTNTTRNSIKKKFVSIKIE